MAPDTPVPNPAAGGSYVRDPVTGELQRMEHTRQALPKGWMYDANDQPVPVPDNPAASGESQGEAPAGNDPAGA